MVPYHVCSKEYPPFKGAFTAVDQMGPCGVGELLL